MEATFKYAIGLASGLVIGYFVHATPSLVGLADGAWLDDVKLRVDRVFTPASREAEVPFVDPSRAALVDEELDYRIAQRLGTLEGWRAFLAAHGGGAYAQVARGEIERLLPADKPLSPTAAEAFAAVSADGKPSSEAAPATQSATVPEAAGQTPGVVSDLTAASDAAPVEKPFSQDDSRAPSASSSLSEGKPASERAPATPPAPQSEVASLGVVSPRAVMNDAAPSETVGSPASTEKAPAPSIHTRRAVAPRPGTQRAVFPPTVHWRRHASRCPHAQACLFSHSSLPPILLALLGERPRNRSAFARYPYNARPTVFSSR
jgi:hypothetical protein